MARLWWCQRCVLLFCCVLLSVLFFARGDFCRVTQTCSAQVTSFPEGVTRSIPLSFVTHHLVKVAQQGSRARALPVRAENHDCTADVCVTCLRADQWVCSKRSPRTHTREIMRVFETVPEITAPRSFCDSISRVIKARELF